MGSCQGNFTFAVELSQGVEWGGGGEGSEKESVGRGMRGAFTFKYTLALTHISEKQFVLIADNFCTRSP